MIVALEPALEGIAAERFMAVARQLIELQKYRSTEVFDSLCDSEMEWVHTTPLLDGNREEYEASVRVLIDLVRLNWDIKGEGWGLELHNSRSLRPKGLSNAEIQELKMGIRNQLRPLVEAQFHQDVIREFIKKMEKPSRKSGQESILRLVADGAELYTRLQPAIQCESQERSKTLTELVKPYLQLVVPSEQDVFTKIPLGDIWRYFRYSWSIPQQSIPGRQMLYLVRDAAHPYHAVMGIASLNNASLNMGAKREDFIGWSVDSFKNRVVDAIKSSCPNDELGRLLTYLEEQIAIGIAGIDHTKLATDEEINSPNEEIIRSLKERGEFFLNKRGKVLKGISSDLKPKNTLEPLHDYVSEPLLALEKKNYLRSEIQMGRQFLIFKKRAMHLAKLLNARLFFIKNGASFCNTDTTLSLLKNEEFSVVVRTVLESIKARHAGSNMLEITTCGGIPPYSSLLSGKLTALLLLSPQVASEYRTRYSKPSIISSQMKNEPVIRDNKLVYLSTTSLYSFGSSQYERLRLPSGTICPEQKEIRYQYIGDTSGYGTVQFSNEAVQAIEKVLNKVNGFKNVNSIFGEGPSPRLRKLSQGLDLLGFSSDKIMQHNQPRLVYSTSLCEEAKEYLCGREATLPDYIINPGAYIDASDRIALFWVNRWLAKRIEHEPTIANLVLTKQWKLSDLLPIAKKDKPTTSYSNVNMPAKTNIENENGINFWRSLAFAGDKVNSDELDHDEMEKLHITLPIEDFIIEKVKQGFSIVLTGNAGDGKTHLLRRLAPILTSNNAVVEEDATAAMLGGKLDNILNSWKQAINEQKPYCLAANEYPLFLLRQSGKMHLPIIQEVDRQCRTRLVYGPKTKNEDPKDKVIVIDLSLRNPLAPDFCSGLFKRLLSDPVLIQYAEQKIDPVFTYNYERISDQRIRNRMIGLFNRLAQRGYRSTVRELWIILARLLFGSKQNGKQNQSLEQWYSQSIFVNDHRFELSRLLAEHCDPINFSHPQWDKKLELPDGTKLEDWFFGLPPITNGRYLDENKFYAIKRAFYFEHTNGDQVFHLDEDYSSDFVNLIQNATDDDTIVKRHIIKDINSCYCPIYFPGQEDALYLWIGHRFQEQPTRSYVASQKIALSELKLFLPRLPSRLENCLEYIPDHFELQYENNLKTIRLKINYSLFKTLSKLDYGLPRNLLPDTDLNRLDLFIEELHSMPIDQTREYICFNVNAREAARILLGKGYSCFEEVESLEQ